MPKARCTMLRSERIVSTFAALLLLVAAVSATAQSKYNLGQPATPEQIAGWDIDVRPDGAGLPEGQGSVSQGNAIYDTQCESCHGTFGESNAYLTLTGVKTKLNFAPTLYDYINRAMPFTHSKALSADDVYAVTAYVLNLNDVVPGDFVADKDSLPKVEMPYRDKLKAYPGMMSVQGKPDVQNTACMQNCEKDVKVSASLPPGFVENLYGDINDNFRGLSIMNKVAPAAASAPVEAVGGQELIQKYACVVCHSVDKKIVGPAFRSVADKYRDNADAAALLTKKIREGGSGVWGTVPMPPQTDASDADLATIAKWLLALPTEK